MSDWQKRKAEWLAGLKAGDTVVVLSGPGGVTRSGTVERVTRTQIIVSGRRYHRDGGYGIPERGLLWRRLEMPE